MAHPVPTEGDPVEVDDGGSVQRGTVTEGIGSFARVEFEDGTTVEAKHESVAEDYEKSWVFIREEMEARTEDEADDADEAGFDPTEMTVEEVRDAVEDADDADVEAALEMEEAQDEPRTTAVEALEDALDSDEE